MDTASFPSFDLPPKRAAAVHLFHDESGFTNRDRFGIHGLLAIPDQRLEAIGNELAAMRRRHGYEHEVHFKDVGGARQSQSPAWLLARDWLRSTLGHFLEEARVKVFVVDTHHEEYDRKRYPKPVNAYRRFAISAGKSMVAWCFRGEEVLLIRPYTDAGNPHAAWVRRKDGTLFDSFARYLLQECVKARATDGKEFYPEEVRFVDPLVAVPSSPSKLNSDVAANLGLSMDELRIRSDFIQLIDLIVGCIGSAVRLDTVNAGKVELAEQIAGYLAHTYTLPLSRALKRSRRLSVSYFPGPRRTPYSISLSGVRQYGCELLRTDAAMKQLYLPESGFRRDAVPGSISVRRS
ncbi:MAG TPA: hypothetical protein PKD75_06570 [Tepidiformaceae bacterium]|nr:hypothetical protein [Tepidiformaceae bacterium]